mmetsp:Transcript_7013/g.26979  ORF Transcript_7013/g.26979 Transcript_7013/m.26979 type:complete len:418 (-) Transcript_7013:37-1290(-)
MQPVGRRGWLVLGLLGFVCHGRPASHCRLFGTPNFRPVRPFPPPNLGLSSSEGSEIAKRPARLQRVYEKLRNPGVGGQVAGISAFFAVDMLVLNGLQVPLPCFVPFLLAQPLVFYVDWEAIVCASIVLARVYGRSSRSREKRDAPAMQQPPPARAPAPAPPSPPTLPWEIAERPPGYFRNVLTTVVVWYACIVYIASPLFHATVATLLSATPLSFAMQDAIGTTLEYAFMAAVGAVCVGRLAPPFWGPKSKWLRIRFRENFMWWSLGGYLFSTVAIRMTYWIMNASLGKIDALQVLLQPAPVDHLQFLSQGGTWEWSSLVGFIPVCALAPFWEEVFFRGFLLPCLISILPRMRPFAVLLSGLAFGLTHGIAESVIPLAVIGCLWAAVYLLSGNLVPAMVTHMLWNARFLLIEQGFVT